jgi:ubiquinone/menaquinone biosynthesis C-methylase UbiE
MTKDTSNHQTETSMRKNASFFLRELDAYSSGVATLDTYGFIRDAVNESIAGAQSLLDVGNGGVFDYDTSLAGRIVAVDLFLDALPDDYRCQKNVTLKHGNALELPEPDGSHDAVLMVMLLHHLIGKSVSESLRNIERAISEAWRVLAPGGRLVIVESCVPEWFYVFERMIFPVATAIIARTIEHPPTLQFPEKQIAEIVARVTEVTPEVQRIRKGRWVIQYGYKWPSALTPVSVWRFVARRAGV